jgi:hypothetical protein
MSTKKNKYIEKEAAHSGDESSEGFEEDDDENNEYEKGSFVVSDDEASSSDDDAKRKAKSKKLKLEADTERKEAKALVKQLKEKHSVYKPHGNKSLDMKHVPPEPLTFASSKPKPKANFYYSISFTNARFAEIFWNVAAKALPYLFFHIEVKEDYAGLRLEAHDTPPTMAIKSKMECIIEAGVDAEGNVLKREAIDGQYFCVESKTLMKCFKCTTLKDTPLRLTKLHDKDGIVFEASTDESDVKTSYVLPLYSKTPSTILSRINTTSDIQIKMNTSVLQKLAEIANALDASIMRFDLYTVEQAKNDGITRNKLTVHFPGEKIQGSHTFFLSTKKRIVKEGVEEFEPITEEDDAFSSSTKWKVLSTNSYSSSKFRLFVANLDVKWCMLGLSTEEKSKPVVIIADCNETGANKTSHAIFISPQYDETEE